jgi:hypothetical protein
MNNRQRGGGGAFAQLLHDRAWQCGLAFMSVVSLISVGLLGVLLGMLLAGKVDPPLTAPQTIAVILAVVLLGISVIGVMLLPFSAGLRYLFWARGERSQNDDRKSASFGARDQWLSLANIAYVSSLMGGILGISASVLVGILRALGY